MNTAATIHRDLLIAQRQVRRIKSGLKAMILALPEPSPQSGIKQIAPNVAVVSLSQLAGVKKKSLMFGGKAVGVRTGMDWAAETYNFRLQYEALSELVEKTESKKIIRTLCEALDNAHIQYKMHKITLHPEVVQNVLNMLDSVTHT